MSVPRIAVLFPGIGYHCDKPLLYYAAKLAASAGCRVLPVPYAGFPRDVRGDEGKLRASFDIALAQAEERLAGVDWAGYGDVVFIGKSIGTVVAARYAEARDLTARHVLLTPLTAAFPHVHGPAVAFHGTADPWADTDAVVAACRARGIPLWRVEGANHSLETGNVDADLIALRETMRRVDQFLREGEAPD